jgi:hypothetical protein
VGIKIDICATNAVIAVLQHHFGTARRCCIWLYYWCLQSYFLSFSKPAQIENLQNMKAKPQIIIFQLGLAGIYIFVFSSIFYISAQHMSRTDKI